MRLSGLPLVVAAVALAATVLAASPAAAAAGPPVAPGGINISLGGGDGAPGDQAIKLIVLFTVLTLAPAILLTLTCFTRIVIVLSFLRQAMGTMGTPPNQVLTGMALFLSAFVMAPTAERVWQAGVGPYLDGRMEGEKALEAAVPPVREFLMRQTREKDIGLFYSITKLPQPQRAADVPMRLLVPAYVLSELRTAFEMGFLIFIPFLLVDIVISSILMSMGMVMLPPAMIALPIKIMLFVVVDGWTLVVDSLARSFA